jgi:hypothetical protein
MQKLKALAEHLEKCRKLPAWSKVPPQLKMKINGWLVQSKPYLRKGESEKQGDE